MGLVERRPGRSKRGQEPLVGGLPVERLYATLKKGFLTQLGAFLAKPAFDALRKEVDYSEYGGAPLLGIDGTCIISHGSSNARAIKNAIRVASEFVKYEINKQIVEAVAGMEKQ